MVPRRTSVSLDIILWQPCNKVQKVICVKRRFPVSWNLSSTEIPFFFKIHKHHDSSLSHFFITLSTQISCLALNISKNHLPEGLFSGYSFCQAHTSPHMLRFLPSLPWGLCSPLTLFDCLATTPSKTEYIIATLCFILALVSYFIAPVTIWCTYVIFYIYLYIFTIIKL